MDEVHGAATALLEFSRSLRPDEPRAVSLSRLAGRVVGTVGGADGATVTLYDRGEPGTIASSDQSLVVLDEAQYQVDDGPCLRAARTQAVVRTELDRMEGGWPTLGAVATGLGIRTSLSCPLFVPEETGHEHRYAVEHHLSGALNVWSRERAAFDPVEAALLTMFCSAASAIITTAAHWARAQARANELLAALESRDTIATAKGIVMVRCGLGPDEAFRWLTDASQRTNRKIRELAALIVADPAVVRRST
jgi:hypothetical protein